MHRLFPRGSGLSLLTAFLLALPGPAWASPPSTIVTWSDWSPYVAEELPDNGIASIVAKEAFAAVQDDITIRFRPWNRAYREAAEGMHLGAYPYAYNKQRSEDFLFTEPMFTTSIRLFSARNHLEPVRTLRTVNYPTICLPQGYNTSVAESLFRETRILIKRPRAMVNCLHMLKRGRVDLVFVSERVGLFLIEQEENLHQDDFFLLNRTFEMPVHIMVPRALPNAELLVETLNRQLTRMKDKGRIQSAFDRYDGATTEQ